MKSAYISLGVGLLAAACASEERTPAGTAGPGFGKTGLSVSMAIGARGELRGLGGIEINAERVACATGESFEPQQLREVLSFQDVTMELRSQGRHQFTDHFVVLPAGCYRVWIQPVDEAGLASEICTPAGVEMVAINDGQTAEVTLVSQCQGPARGAIDVATIVNHPPHLVSVEYSPSKFVYECERVRLCATAIDPDGDRIVFDWSQALGSNMLQAPVVEKRSQTALGVTECVALVPGNAGRRELRIHLTDIHEGQAQQSNRSLIPGQEGQVEQSRVEQGRAQQSVVSSSQLIAGSEDSLVIPLYSQIDLDFACFDQQAGQLRKPEGKRTVELAENCTPTTAAQYYCASNDPALCPDGQFDPLSIYPSCE